MTTHTEEKQSPRRITIMRNDGAHSRLEEFSQEMFVKLQAGQICYWTIFNNEVRSFFIELRRCEPIRIFGFVRIAARITRPFESWRFVERTEDGFGDVYELCGCFLKLRNAQKNLERLRRLERLQEEHTKIAGGVWPPHPPAKRRETNEGNP